MNNTKTGDDDALGIGKVGHWKPCNKTKRGAQGKDASRDDAAKAASSRSDSARSGHEKTRSGEERVKVVRGGRGERTQATPALALM
jgi:hypothetical protein